VRDGEPQTIIVGDGKAARDIAYIAEPAQKPGAASLFWLSGFMSDMASTKATALSTWAKARGMGCTRFDYSGHGVSGGAFTGGTIGRWLDEAAAIFTQKTFGPQIVIGSSMGGHIALILLRKLMRAAPEHAARIKGLVLIAPAWDMTEELMWKKFPPAIQREIMEQGFHLSPSAYASPYKITRALIEDGRDHLLARQPFNPGRPVTILQGLLDPDVPAAHTRELLTFLTGGQVTLIEIPDGEHRLSRAQDLDQLYSAISSMT
jgi:pimeloyl-ACP methyl ester carboxylesterase